MSVERHLHKMEKQNWKPARSTDDGTPLHVTGKGMVAAKPITGDHPIEPYLKEAQNLKDNQGCTSTSLVGASVHDYTNGGKETRYLINPTKKLSVNQKEVLKDQCLVSSILLGIALNKSCETQQACDQYKSILHPQNNADYKKRGDFLIQERQKLDHLIGKGPHDLKITVPILAQFFDAQIVILGSNYKKLEFCFPKVFDFDKQPIFLFQFKDPSESGLNHIELISKPMTFWRQNGYCCFVCGRSTSGPTFKRTGHYCSERKKQCMSCNRRIRTSSQYMNSLIEGHFCDQRDTSIDICSKCQLTTFSDQCKEEHNKASKCDRGYFCYTCSSYTWKEGRPGRSTLQEIRENHVCETKKKMTCFCKNRYENSHLCEFNAKAGMKNYDYLGFLQLVKMNLNPMECNDCIPSHHCPMHAMYSSPENIPSVGTLAFEVPSRQSFQLKLFSTSLLDIKLEAEDEKETKFDFCYLPCSTELDKKSGLKKSSFGRISKPSDYIQNALEGLLRKNNKSVEEQIFQFLLLENHTEEMTVLCGLADLNLLEQCLLSLDIIPVILENANNVFLMQIPGTNLRFLAREKYLTGSLSQLSETFNIDIEESMFPFQKNHPANFSYAGSPFDLEDYILAKDSIETVQVKTDRYEKIMEKACKNFPPFEFKKDIKACAIQDLKLFAKLLLTYLQEMLLLQNEVFGSSPKGPFLPWLNPFTRPICSFSGNTKPI